MFELPETSKALVYGDVSLNIIDGSSVWLTSIAATLTEVFDEVHVLLKAPIDNDRLLTSLTSNPKVVVHAHAQNPAVEPLTPRIAAQRLAYLAEQLTPQAIIVRGLQVCTYAVSNRAIASKLWAYVTDLPFPPSTISDKQIQQIRGVARKARRMFAQTEAARSYLESICPEACGKTVLLPPMVPDHFFTALPKPGAGGVLTLIYSGKFAKPWRTLEMLELPAALRKLGVPAQLVMVGDKFQKDPSDPQWHIRMQERLTCLSEDEASGVMWVGGVPRAEAMRLVAQADLGLSWRAPELDGSLEISTKLLEYSAAGTAVLANRCAQHEQVFGASYPLLGSATATVDEMAHLIASLSRPELHALGQENQEKVRYFSSASAAGRFKTYFSPTLGVPGAGRNTKVAVASHDLKFMGDILQHLEASPEYDLMYDHWESLHKHSEERSLAILDEADVIICEWCGPNALWYSRNKRPGQRLIVRLHRFEVNGPWIQDIDFSRVDDLVFVSNFQKEETFKQLGELPAQNIHVIPNSVDGADLDREKEPAARFHLGVLGFVPYLKRPDRALDLLEKLLEADDRYYLHFRGRLPWEFPHEWSNPVQQQLYLHFFDRIRVTPGLKDHVIFDEAGPDVANWFRKIGHILSPSSYESFHLAITEGMASGATPIVWDRAGAEEIFGSENVYSTVEDMADKILATRENMSQGEAKTTAQQWDTSTVLPQWDNLIAPAPQHNRRFDQRND